MVIFLAALLALPRTTTSAELMARGDPKVHPHHAATADADHLLRGGFRLALRTDILMPY
jgi:hypothetical protein